MLRSALIGTSRSPLARGIAERSPMMRPIVNRFVAGDSLDTALSSIRELLTDRYVSLDHLGEATTDRATADATVEAYRVLLDRIAANGLSGRAEVSVKLSALGQALPSDGNKIALDNARRIGAFAAAAGTTMTIDMEDHTTTDATLSVVRDLRVDFPWVGAVLQAYLRRTEQDCEDLSGPGSRIRLCKGAYDEPASVAFRDKSEVDSSYVRCLKVLMNGRGYPMVATHDPVLVDIAKHLARQANRGEDSYEFQMLYGIRPVEQAELAAQGHSLRVYVPYGSEWFAYFVRRLAERPANMTFFLRSFLTRS
jgi:proline dehydrogenase